MLITETHLFVELFSHVLKRGKQLANMHDNCSSSNHHTSDTHYISV